MTGETSRISGRDLPAAALTGVGEKRAEALAKAGIHTLSDLLHYYPRAYQNRGDVRSLEVIREITRTGEPLTCSAVLTVGTEPQVRRIRSNLTLVKFSAFDESGSCEITYFHMEYVKRTFHVGASFRFFGRFTYDYGRVQVTNPIYEPWTENKTLPELVPVYPLVGGLSQKMLYQYTGEAIMKLGGSLMEYLPAWVLREASLPSHGWMVNVLHRPQSLEQLEAAKRRLVFEELFLQFVCMAQNGGGAKIPNRYPVTWNDISRFAAQLPYELTDGQKKCLAEIAGDMAGDWAMNRILIGDVGSGKTVVAAVSAYLTIRSGYRAALMVPTEILAAQHYRELSVLFEKLGIGTVLLTGSTPKKKRDAILASLRDDSFAAEENSASLIIGTHALLTGDVQIDRLGLVIIDEQHRFGVMQRSAILEKGEDCHCLFMSATPIPRTLSLVAYGSLAVSSIDVLPRGRQPIDTFIVNSSYHARMLNFIRKQAEEGHQTYIVCPAVEERAKEKESTDPEELANLSLFDLNAEPMPTPGMQTQIGFALTPEAPPLKAAVTYAETLAEELPELKVGLVHGKMKPAEKDAVMEAFCRGETHVLVATTVIEVGVNVPSATLMIVENAERFGLSQLHQLRGRVGRGDAKSYFILVSDSHDEGAMNRLKTLKDTANGYEIAQADLEMRGAGDFITGTGTRQSGQSMFRLAASCRDTAFMEHTAKLARELIAEDPELAGWPLLREKTDRIRTEGSRMEN
ncbi:MAG: ATP-dependent DNA helicase RecG [Clostridia bacterium]|nr:ATP-dependent DNA helicase RecG [Clostridia bacterium]